MSLPLGLVAVRLAANSWVHVLCTPQGSRKMHNKELERARKTMRRWSLEKKIWHPDQLRNCKDVCPWPELITSIRMPLSNGTCMYVQLSIGWNNNWSRDYLPCPAHSLHSDWGKMFKGFNVVAVYQRQSRNGFQSLYSNVFWRFLLAHSLPNPITIILLNMCWGFSKKWSERESKQKPWKGLAFLAIDETSERNKRLLHNVDVVVKIWTERKP